MFGKVALFDFCWTAERSMSSRKQKYCAFCASFSEIIKLLNENNFTQGTDLFSEQAKILICDWSTRECHKLRSIPSSIPFTTQSDVDASKCFRWRKWPLSGPCGTKAVEKKKEGSKQNILVSYFRKMFARQILKVQLHRRRMQSKVRKNLKIGAQRLKAWKAQHLNVIFFCALDSL